MSRRPLTTYLPEPRHVRLTYAVLSPLAMLASVVLGILLDLLRVRRNARRWAQ